ncbi:hypothetical protein BH10PAT4_BH10PAT4_3560 [soil metagenome]
MSLIFLHNLVVKAKHGIHAHEKMAPQRFRISIELDVNTPQAYVSDDINDTISYSQLRRTIIDVTQNNSFDLIERLAQVIIDAVLIDSRVNSVTLTIEKLDVYKDAVPGITVKQSRKD